MTFSRRVLSIVVFGTVLLATILLATGPAAHAAADPAEVAFWQSVEARKDPREYQTYLDTYPNGAFAALARLRLQDAAGSGPIARPPRGSVVAPIPMPAPAPVVEADPDGPALSIEPANGRVGQIFSINCINLPENGSQDMIIVVRAGSPVLPPSAGGDQMKVLTAQYSANCSMYHNHITAFGPYAPGNYEARFMSVLYNDDHQYEMKAKVAFSVR